MSERLISNECFKSTGFSYTLSLISGKYKMTILYVLAEFGIVRFNEMISEAGRHPECTYYVLVPEQFTMATQREFVRRQENHAILNVDVLSFKRLAYRVFEEFPP